MYHSRSWEWLLWARLDLKSFEHQTWPFSASTLFSPGALNHPMLVVARSRRWWSSESVLHGFTFCTDGQPSAGNTSCKAQQKDKFWFFFCLQREDVLQSKTLCPYIHRDACTRPIKVIADLHRAESFRNTQLHMVGSCWGSEVWPEHSHIHGYLDGAVWGDTAGIKSSCQALGLVQSWAPSKQRWWVRWVQAGSSSLSFSICEWRPNSAGSCHLYQSTWRQPCLCMGSRQNKNAKINIWFKKCSQATRSKTTHCSFEGQGSYLATV